MEFLEDNQICAWAEEHGITCGQRFQLCLPDLPSLGRREYASGRRSGQEGTAVADLINGLGPWDECLVCVTLWGVWASGEDWPQFYAWRGRLGERRSLDVAPGHRFVRDEPALLAELLTLIMENAWDADILCAEGRSATRTRAKISHDEWYETLKAPSAGNAA